MQCVKTQIIDAEIPVLHILAFHLLHQDFACVFGFLIGIRPGKTQICCHAISCLISDAQFEFLRRGFAVYICDLHSVVAGIPDSRLADIHRDVRRDIVGGIMHFVEELLLAGLLGDQAAAVRRFCDVQTVLCDLRDRETEIVHIRHAPPVIVEVAAGALSAALQKMSDHDASREIIQIGICPAKLISERCQEHCGVCRASGEDHVSSLRDAVHDGLPSVIDVRVHYFVLNVVEIACIVHVREGHSFFK